jgi:hypothetical protein
MMKLLGLSSSLMLLSSVSMSSAAVVYLQDVGGNPGFTFNGTPVTQALFDDTYIQLGGSASSLAANFGNSFSMQIRTTSTGLTNFALIAVKDMFSLVPATSSGNPIQINSAALYLASGTTTMPSNYTIDVRRVLTDWLANAAGNNETRVSGAQRNGDVSNPVVNGQPWVSAGGNFGTSDRTDTNAALGVPFVTATYGTYVGVDITEMMKDMYTSNTNFGFAVSTSIVQNDFVNFRSSEDTLLPATFETFRPVLMIDYTYIPEPGSLSLLALGGLVLIRRRRVTA